MKKLLKYLLVASLLFLTIAPTPAMAQDPTPPPSNRISGDQVVIGNTYTLRENEVLDGNMLVIGGTASTAESSTINGDLLLVGGTLTIDGTVNGEIVSIGGVVNLGDSAVINGDLSQLGGSLQRSSAAIINGSVNQNVPNDFVFDFPLSGGRWFPFESGQSPLSRVLNALFRSLAMAILAVLIGLLLPHNIKNIAAAITREPLVSGGIGILTIIVAPIMLMLLIITILLIPITVLGFIALSLAIMLGLIAVGYEIGQRLAVLFKTTWHPSVSAGIGTLALTLVTGIANFIPCIGWVLGFVAAVFGLGAVIISRVGSEKYAKKLIQSVVPSSVDVPSPITGETAGDEPSPSPTDEPQV